jgi:hypothetical protein
MHSPGAARDRGLGAPGTGPIVAHQSRTHPALGSYLGSSYCTGVDPEVETRVKG